MLVGDGDDGTVIQGDAPVVRFPFPERGAVGLGNSGALLRPRQDANRFAPRSKDIDPLVAVLVGEVDAGPRCDTTAPGEVEEEEVGVFGRHLLGPRHPPPLFAGHLREGFRVLLGKPRLLDVGVQEGEFLLQG